MKHRHEMHKEHRKSGGEVKHRARGGKADYYAGGESNVAKEAEEKKNGGKVAKRKGGGMVEGHKAKHRLDRPGRKRGGAIGADMKPLSSAARETQAEGHKVERESDED